MKCKAPQANNYSTKQSISLHFLAHEEPMSLIFLPRNTSLQICLPAMCKCLYNTEQNAEANRAIFTSIYNRDRLSPANVNDIIFNDIWRTPRFKVISMTATIDANRMTSYLKVISMTTIIDYIGMASCLRSSQRQT